LKTDQLIDRYPNLYHMAEKGSWPSIREIGLLSTSASLSRFGIDGPRRHELGSQHRPEKTTIQSRSGATIVLRDQKPMPVNRIAQALGNTATPEQWYELINNKVFFWVSHERLLRLLGARAYRDDEHDVITLDTAKLVGAHEHTITLCHMNSGNTFPIPSKRDFSIFKSIADYPTKRNGQPEKEVVELTVANQVPDISRFVTQVQRMKGASVIGNLPL